MFIFRQKQKPTANELHQKKEISNVQPAPPPLIPVMKTSQRFETVLGQETIMEGKLECQGNIRLDGQFTGTLEISGHVLVGVGAKIEADIFARNISIAGSVHGNVGGEKVQLLRTAEVIGDITAQSLSINEGATIEGKISMVSESEEAETVISAEHTHITDDLKYKQDHTSVETEQVEIKE